MFKKKFSYYFDKYKYASIVFLLISPFIILFWTTVQSFHTLRSCFPLINGKLQTYGSQFSQGTSFDQLTTRTLGLITDRHGRKGKCTYFGDGAFDLSWLYFHSLIPLYLCQLGPICPLLGMYGWAIVQISWISNAPALKILIMLFIMFFGSIFYIITYGRYNYNALGWPFFALAIFSLSHDNLYIFSLSVFLCTFFSITVSIISLQFFTLFILFNFDYTFLIYLIPAILKIASHVFFMFRNGSFMKNFIQNGKILSWFRSKSKYRMKKKYTIDISFDVFAYLLLLMCLFTLIYFAVENHLPKFMCICILLYCLHYLVFRFSDIESWFTLILTVGFIDAALSQSYWPLLGFLIISCPFPVIFDVPTFNPCKVKPFKLYNIQPVLNALENFLEPVTSGQKVFMAFNNPNDAYSSLFDNQSRQVRALMYASVKRYILFLPTIFFIMKNNDVAAPSYWGRDVDSATLNCKSLNANFLVIYLPFGEHPSPCWAEAGFLLQKQLSWKNHSIGDYDWWLFKTPEA